VRLLKPRSGRRAPPQAAERLQKVLSQLGLASRREAEAWIRAGRLSVNGQIAQLGQRVGLDDQMRLDGRPIRQRAAQTEPVLLCHRSPGQALLPRSDAVESFAGQLPSRTGKRYISVSPLPQIDGGLELLTADGSLAVKLQRSVRKLPMEFSLRVRGELAPQQIEGLKQGQLDRGARLRIVSLESGGGEGANRWYTLQAIGVSGNDLRQLLERQGVTVSRVLRTRLGTLLLDRALARGRSRELTNVELQQLLLNPESESQSDSGPDNPAIDP
jgi:23S rRNA pseudouridine2605 synthase